ncbi:MAG: hypothetical protein NVS9B3_13520 [Gemmatimonadaceae bacterium]
MRATTILAVALGLTVSAAAASAQAAQAAPPAPQKTTVLSAQPISLILQVYAAEVEHALSPTTTLGVGGTYLPLRNNWDSKYLSGDIKFRYYPDGHALRGFSFGAQAGYTEISERGYSSTPGVPGPLNTSSGPTIGVSLDYNWLLGESRSFYVGLGAGAKRLFITDKGYRDISFAYPTVRLSVGYAY